ncbi:NADPH-dependent diflavin oxidoreductase 1 [Wickerhamomyces ciferrii]|uniref:NADPH-dependent diflavin oxidoreductase 1 n=1 Tax=Wickerhamomyces ciferrii (strain ATCC 14091 / BCRC 22168 / CBS 111 / JCM 3599 / NBRC 0793 / NRRL Y-1031 F-60-10) TaxID=1206466 RepID=K0KS50_WICCF|nr:NADPH-dependent diflavin oxidoreductase 1 [Wickerhamomyces ciferrii]CCH45991.1 NADPH-dependent diflavin oxidoreductase 1 [Wickerhamomyces ciferrii]
MDRSITVLFGSETGNAQDFAETLTRSLERLHFKVHLSSLDDYDLKNLLSVRLLIIFCSTTGQGEFPKNSRKFWKFMLKRKLPNDLLNHLYFTTFGLGDSSYPKFNWAVKKLHNRILQLGGVEFSKRAESDEQSSQGADGYYIEFQNLLLKNLNEKFPLPLGQTPVPDDVKLPPKFQISIDLKKPKRKTDTLIKEIALTRNDPNLRIGTVEKNIRITSDDHFQDVRHFSILDKTQQLNYQPGDTISLFPTNDPKEVDSLLEIQGWTEIADRRILIEEPYPLIDGSFIKTPTLRSLFTHHLDLRSIPRRSFFALLYHFASDEREREKLKEFSSYKDPEELYNYANRPRRSILETIQEFFSVKIPLEYILDLFPLIKPRLFSIASSPNSSKVELTIAVVQYKTMIRRIRKGLCTSWLKNLKEGDEIIFRIDRNNLKLPKPEVPIIMIAPGTGIAPMRSLIHQRVFDFNANKNQLYLFLGNRYHNKDFLYGEEWKELEKKERLTLFTAFSRENGGYVQDQLYLQSELITELLTHGNAVIYICGSSGKMPNQVRMTFETILEETKGLSKNQAKQYLLELEANNRYLQETW